MPDLRIEGADLGVESLGWSLGAVGDINGDGYDDVCSGVGPQAAPQLVCFTGGPEGIDPSRTVTLLDSGGEDIGPAGALAAGDVNADGRDDILVFEPYASFGEEEEGVAYLYLGDAADALLPSWSFEPNRPNALLSAGGAAGDVNGDGYDDVVIGDPSFEEQADVPGSGKGRALLFLGSAQGLSPDADWVFEGDRYELAVGLVATGVSDVDGDGFSDVAVFVPGAGSGTVGPEVDAPHEFQWGMLWLFRGSATGLATKPDTMISGGASAPYTGAFTSLDFNGDDEFDLLVVAQSSESERELHIYASPTEALVNTASAVVEHPFLEVDRLSVVSVGSFNADSVPDVAVGSPFVSSGGAVSGRVSLANVWSDSTVSEFEVLWQHNGMSGDRVASTVVGGNSDYDADGFDDIIVGSAVQGNGGTLSLFFGSCDSDDDGQCDSNDVCPFDPRDDEDGDGLCANEDNCPFEANPGQTDEDSDGTGDACESSGDGGGTTTSTESAAGDGDEDMGNDGGSGGCACNTGPPRRSGFILAFVSLMIMSAFRRTT